MSTTNFLALAKRFWVVILGAVILASAVVATTALVEEPRYRSTSTVFVSAVPSSSLSDLSLGNQFVQQAVTSYAGVATKDYVLDRVSKALSFRELTPQLRDVVSASADQSAATITISADSKSPTQAAEIANTVAKELSTAVADLIPQGQQFVRLTQVQPASVPTVGSGVGFVPRLLGGLFFGLLLGFGVSWLLFKLDTRARSATDAESAAQAPVLSGIPLEPTSSPGALVGHSSGHPEMLETFRTLKAKLDFLIATRGSSTIVVTSSVAAEGKTTVACNAALAFAAAAKKVLIVDADLRRPSVATYLGLDGGIGLTDVLIENVDQALAVQSVSDRLDVLPAGSLAPNPNELLQSDRFSALLEEWSRNYDTVIIDTPPALALSDAAVVARGSHVLLYVCALGRARKREIVATRTSLLQLGTDISGVVMNLVPRTEARYYGYGTYYATHKPQNVSAIG